MQRARREKGWSIGQLSKRSGVPRRVIREIESGSPTYVPSEANTALLAEDLKAEGRAQQRKAAAEKEAEQREKTRQAEKERDKQELKDKGLLGNVGDTLPKL